MNYRLILAWSSGVIITILVYAVLSILLSVIGIPNILYFEEAITYSSRYYDYESDSSMTLPGSSIIVISFLAGFRIGRNIFYNNLNGGFSRDESLQFIAWVIGLSICFIFGIVLHLIFKPSWSLSILELAIIAISYFLAKTWYDKLNSSE